MFEEERKTMFDSVHSPWYSRFGYFQLLFFSYLIMITTSTIFSGMKISENSFCLLRSSYLLIYL